MLSSKPTMEMNDVRQRHSYPGTTTRWVCNKSHTFAIESTECASSDEHALDHPHVGAVMYFEAGSHQPEALPKVLLEGSPLLVG